MPEVTGGGAAGPSLEKVHRRTARFILNQYHNTSSVSEMLNEP